MKNVIFYLQLSLIDVMATKRGADGDSGSSGEPPQKKVQFEPVRIGPISTLEEMDIKVLQFQNKKLAQVGSFSVLFLIC